MIVLDTHIFLWFANGSEQLDASLRKRIEARHEDVLVPTICIWECLVLAEKGRIDIVGVDKGATMRRLIDQCGFKDAPLNLEIAILSRTLPFSHEDPADRFIAATAYASGADLATADERLRALPWINLA